LTTIKHIDIIVLSFPVAHYISDWRPVTRTYHLIVFLLTDSGFIGVGEGTPYGSSIAETYAKALSLAKAIRGLTLEDALNALVSREYEEFEEASKFNYGAYLALESAILHTLSQYKGLKHEAKVLGGIYRTKVPITYAFSLNHPRTMLRELKSAIRAGFKYVKFKVPCNFEELRKTLETLCSTGCDVEDVTLIADANGCFHAIEKARKALSTMERYSIKIVEQPLPYNKLKEMASLKREFHGTIKIMLDESLRKPSDVELFAQMECADIVNFHPSKLGCLTITRDTIIKAQKLGLEIYIGSALMTDIGLLHYLNLAASIPRLDYPLEERGFYNTSCGYSIIKEPLEIINGSITLRNLTVSDLDFDMIKKFLVHSLSLERLLTLAGQIRYIFMNQGKFASLIHKQE